MKKTTPSRNAMPVTPWDGHVAGGSCSACVKAGLLLLLLLALLLASCGDAAPAAPVNGGTRGAPEPVWQTGTGTFREFALPQKESGLMRPSVDAQGRIWFGEMSRNYLGYFEPQAQTFWQQTPPRGKSGLMVVVVARDDTIWFVEQYANYIGHLWPTTGQYHIYPLPNVTRPDPSHPGQNLTLPAAPNDMVMDRQGILWFTELNANAIGSLNTVTGALRQYPLNGGKDARALDPYGITVDPQGTIWFSEATSSQLSSLDPRTGRVQAYPVPGIASPLMEVASDAEGHIWATSFTGGKLLQYDPVRAHFTSYTPPGASNSGLYGLLISSSGEVWVAITAANRLACLDLRDQRYLTYAIPSANSLPIGLVEDQHHAIWFTESGSDKLGVLQP